MDPQALTVDRVAAGQLSLSRIIFGAMARRQASSDQRISLLLQAIDAGLDTVDTAPLYEFGDSERWVGQALRRRSGVTVCTKVGLRWDVEWGEVLFRFTDVDGSMRAVRKDGRPESVRWEVEQSLLRMDLETLDLVQLHHPDPHTPIEETVGALADLVRQGKVREVGVSNCDVDLLRRAHATRPLATLQSRYNMVDRTLDGAIIPWAREHGVAVLAYSPLAEGVLSGRIPTPERQTDNPAVHPRNLGRIQGLLQEVLQPIAAERGVSPAAVSLAWCLTRPGLAAIVGASSPSQIRENAAATTLRLTGDEVTRIHEGLTRARFDPQAGTRRRDRLAAWPGAVAGRVRSRAGRAVSRLARRG